MKRIAVGLLSLMMIVFIAACGKETPVEDIPKKEEALNSEEMPGKKENVKAGKADKVTEETKNPVLEGNTFWKAYQFTIDGEKENLPSEKRQIDVILWENGTAQFREIIDGIYLTDDRQAEARWTQTEDGEILMHHPDYDFPYWEGILRDGEMELECYGGVLSLKQEKMPETAGERLHPAQLQGTWLQVSGVVEGDEWDAMPGYFGSLVFKTQWNDATSSYEMTVDSEEKDHLGMFRESFWDFSTEILDECLYEGCGNDEWSVHLGEYSQVNEDGYPTDMEYYVTLVDENTLLKQCYYTLDGAPAVSYQTYQRMLPRVSHDLVMAHELEGGDYECVGYVDENGVEYDAPPGMSDFYVHLDISPYCTVGWWDEATDERISINGEWTLGDSGGTLLLVADNFLDAEESENTFWLAGAVRENYTQTQYEVSDATEMYLWYQHGIIKLEHVGGSGGENYGGDDPAYEDTMNYLEGNAFAAPEGTLFILYGENAFLGETAVELEDVYHYNLSSGSSHAELILLTAVLDNTLFWYEDESRNEVWSEVLNAGESVVLKVDVPETAKEVLCININDEAVYYYEISSDTISEDAWYYVTE